MSDEYIEEEIIEGTDGTEYEEVLEDGDFIEEEILDDSFTEVEYIDEQPTPANATPAPAAVGAPVPAPMPMVGAPAPASIPMVGAPAPAPMPMVGAPAPAPMPAVGAPAPAPMPAVGAPAPAPMTMVGAPVPAPRRVSTVEGTFDDPNAVDKLQSWLGNFESGQASVVRPSSPQRPYPFEIHDIRPAASEQLAQPSLSEPAPAPAPVPLPAPTPLSTVTPQQSQADFTESSPPETPQRSNMSGQGIQPEQRLLDPTPAAAQPQLQPRMTDTTPVSSPPIERTVETHQPEMQQSTTQEVSSGQIATIGADNEVEEEGTTPGVAASAGDVENPVPEKTTAGTQTEKTKAGQEDEGGRNDRFYFLAFCWVSILFVLIILAILIWGTETIDNPFRSDDDGPDFVGDIPTTPMDSYMPNNCDFEGQRNPNVFSQCQCNNEVTDLTSDARGKYDALVAEFIPVVYPEGWNLPFESCETANQALIWLSTVNARNETDLIQKYIMAYLYFGTNGPNWDVQTSWITDEEVCDWYGLSCEEQVLQSVELETNSLMGMIPSELGLLTGLQTLSFFENALSGSIPMALFGIPELRMVILSSNRLYGSIPSDVAATPNLEVLRLGNNQLGGSIISELGQATLLRELELGPNEFEGELPTELYQLSDLVYLNLESNIGVIGRIPTEFGLMTDLRYLSVSGTNFRARFPAEYAALTDLEELHIANTLVGGDIPISITELSALKRLNFAGSRFRQTLPDYIQDLTNLEYLALNDNALDGPIPPQIGNMTTLTTLLLHGNELDGTVPSQLGLLTALETLTLQDNFLTGRAPTEVCSLRELELDAFSTDCPSRTMGVVCPVDSCCTSCRTIPSLDEET